MIQNEDSNTLINLSIPRKFYPQMVGYLASLYEENAPPVAPEQSGSEDNIPERDEALITRMYMDSESRHRRLLKALAAEAGRWVFTAELAKSLGVKSGPKGMAGIFGAFGRRAKHRYGGQKPWESEWDPVQGEARYRMEP